MILHDREDWIKRQCEAKKEHANQGKLGEIYRTVKDKMTRIPRKIIKICMLNKHEKMILCLEYNKEVWLKYEE